MLQVNKHITIADSDHLVPNYQRLPVHFTRGDGVFLFDSQNKRYLDFLCGIAVTSFGHNHPVITEAIKRQLHQFCHTSNLFESPQQNLCAGLLCRRSGLDRVFFCNSGTEANEAAIKFTRKKMAGRSTILTTVDSFHGRTYGSMSASGQKKIHDGFYPLCPGFTTVGYNDSVALEAAIDEKTAAIMIEPILGEAGIIVPSSDYLQAIRTLCDTHGLLMIVDEIQTGLGRTGAFFAFQWHGVKPDIVTCAKALANGLPLGAVLCTENVALSITPGCHGSTFGGNPVSVAAGCAVLDLLDEALLCHINECSTILIHRLQSIQSKLPHCFKQIRGKGLLIGVELSESVSAKQVQKKLLENTVLVGTSGEHTIRILPPFIVKQCHIDTFCDVFSHVLSQYDSGIGGA
ncbi:MAG: aspartate aminotransferase family protein [Chitinivibrionales bacterium]|nr:aspartate aminotransferase family protein [Chitinivibrionales bacterium]